MKTFLKLWKILSMSMLEERRTYFQKRTNVWLISHLIRRLAVHVSLGANQPSPRSSELAQQKHCQLELKDTEEMGWNERRL